MVERVGRIARVRTDTSSGRSLIVLFDRADELVDVAAVATIDEFRRKLDAEVAAIRSDDGESRLARQRAAVRVTSWTDPVENNGSSPVTPSPASFTVVLVCGRGVPSTWRSDAADRDGPVVEWAIPVEIPARVLADLAGTVDTHAVVVRSGVVLHAPGKLNLGRTSRWRTATSVVRCGGCIGGVRSRAARSSPTAANSTTSSGGVTAGVRLAHDLASRPRREPRRSLQCARAAAVTSAGTDSLDRGKIELADDVVVDGGSLLRGVDVRDELLALEELDDRSRLFVVVPKAIGERLGMVVGSSDQGAPHTSQTSSTSGRLRSGCSRGRTRSTVAARALAARPRCRACRG